MSNTLTITKGGRLIENYWYYDKKIEKGSYLKRDVTATAITRLFEKCDLEEGITLRDVFLLLETELRLFDLVLGNWTRQQVEIALQASGKPYSSNYDPDEIEYLELYRYFEVDKEYETEKTILLGTDFTHLHALGFELKEDKISMCFGDIEHPKGQRIPYGLTFTEAKDIINTPIKLNKQIQIYDVNCWNGEGSGHILTTELSEFTLGSILNAITWELSFLGAPEDKPNKIEELKSTVDSLEGLE